jgi:hypothetical protein
MSFDKANFARTVKEQQAGISPQMWPIICPDNGHLVLNHPYEISINPCDCIWLPITYDKSYGINPWQYDTYQSLWMASPSDAGQNVCDVYDLGPGNPTPPIPFVTQAPLFALRFNTPNNPWLLWGLSTEGNGNSWYVWGTGNGYRPFGCASHMRSISGPISRLWIQYYRFAQAPGFPTIAGGNQIVLMSMLGYSQQSTEQFYNALDQSKLLTNPPPTQHGGIACGGYRTTDLDTADLLALGVKPTPGAK